MFKLNLILRTLYFEDKSIYFFADATGSKRFILNVDVTPEHRPRRPRPQPRLVSRDDPVTSLRSSHAADQGGSREKILLDCDTGKIRLNCDPGAEDRIHSVIVSEEAVVTSLRSSCVTDHGGAGGSLRASRRSIFSALGQWLCQGQAAGPESLYVSPGVTLTLCLPRLAD